MRVFGSEMISYLSVFATAAVSCALFPVEGLGFRPAPDASSDAGVAFVMLDAKTEDAAFRATKTSGRRQGGAGRHYAELVFAELPEAKDWDVLSSDARARPPDLPLVTSGRSAYLPSQRAAAPERIVPDEARSALPFSREELLNLDTKGL